jgi:hypothetical protein
MESGIKFAKTDTAFQICYQVSILKIYRFVTHKKVKSNSFLYISYFDSVCQYSNKVLYPDAP